MFGNANLLPHKEINFVKPSESFDTGHVELNGIRLGSLDNYCEILESSVDNSKVATAVNSEDFLRIVIGIIKYCFVPILCMFTILK